MKYCVCILSLICFFSCSKKENNIQTSFYYWKTQFKIDNSEEEFLKESQINKMYVRYFDIGLKGGNSIPISAITFDSIPNGMQIIPVVYIKNEVVLKPNLDIKELSANMLKYIGQINKVNNIQINEIQLDCDWNLTSKNQFFALVDQIKKESKLKLSATIRLHQIKYFEKTGIPNVDEGILMYYNMGTIAADSLNSIYDRDIAKKYINTLSHYPLKLNVALPIYSWLVHTRNQKPIKLISRIRKEQLDSIPNFKKIDDNRYLVQESETYFGTFFKKEDIVKIESISAKQIEEMIADLSEVMKEKPSEIIFYDFDRTNIKSYEDEFFKKAVNRF